MRNQPEALRLADDITQLSPIDWALAIHQRNAAAAELRRLHAASGQLLAALQTVMQLDVRGHTLASRLQFTPSGRQVLSVVDAAIALATPAPSNQEG